MEDYSWTNEPMTGAFDNTDALPEPNIHLDSSQGQEGVKEDNSSPADQNKDHSKTTQTEEQATEQSFCQQTMQDTWSAAWYTKNLENPRKVISTHGPSS